MRVDAQSTDPYSSAYADDLVIAQTTPPSAGDIANAEQQATVFGTATAGTGTRSLTVTASSYLDQMNLIATNAAIMQSDSTLCPPPSSGDSTDSTATPSTDTGTGDGGGE